MAKRERFNTTLTAEHRKKLLVLMAEQGLKAENHMIEKLIDDEWKRRYEHDMENKQGNK